MTIGANASDEDHDDRQDQEEEDEQGSDGGALHLAYPREGKVKASRGIRTSSRGSLAVKRLSDTKQYTGVAHEGKEVCRRAEN
jgi:hypothetical protein